MGLSSFCIEQRERETQRLKSFLAFSLMGSALLHGALLILGATIPWEQVLEPEAEPIEFTLVEPTEPEEELEKDEKKETELEVATDSSRSSTLLSGAGNSSSDMPSVELPQQERSNPSPEQPLKSPRIERTNTPQPSVESKTEALPQSISRPTVALKPEPKQDIPTQQAPKPQPSAIPDAKVSPSSTQNEESKPEQRQEIAQEPKQTQNVTPSQPPVVTATTRLENSVESIIDRIRTIGRQQPSSGEQESKVAANPSSNTQGTPQPLGNFRSNAPIPRGGNRGNSSASSEGARNSDAGGNGTITARGTSTDRGSTTNTGRDRGTIPKPGSQTTVAAAPRTRTPEIPVGEERGSGSSGSGFRGYTQPKYPSSARRRGVEGDTKVTFDVDANGRAVNVRVVRSSGNEALDRAVVEEARRRWRDPSASGRRDVSATVAFEIEGSQRQRQNRERRQQREETRRNRESVATTSRETEVAPTRRRTVSATTGNIPVETRRRTQPRSRQAVTRQSESAAVPRRRQQAAAPTPRRRQQAAAPTPRRRQQAAAPTPRRRQQAAAPTPRRRRQAAAPTPRRRQQAAAPTPRRRRQAAAPAPRRRQQAAPKPRVRQAAPAPRPRQNSPAPAAAGSGSSN